MSIIEDPGRRDHQMHLLALVANERDRQDRKWGEQNHDDFLWCTILLEEVGEAAKAALHAVFEGGDPDHLEVELIQVAAVAVSWLECIERRRYA